MQPHTSLLPVPLGAARAAEIALGGCHSTQDGQRADPASWLGAECTPRAWGGDAPCWGTPLRPTASLGCFGSAACRSALAEVKHRLQKRSAWSNATRCPHVPVPRPPPIRLLRTPKRRQSQGCLCFEAGWEEAGFSQPSGFPPACPVPTTSSPVAVISAAAPLGAVPGAWLPHHHHGAAAPQQCRVPWGEQAQQWDVTVGGQGEERVPGVEDGRGGGSKGKGKKAGGVKAT